MAWERLAHTAWNNSTPDDMEIEFAKRQNIKVITYIVASGNVNAKWILNDSTGNPYTNKYGDNGANMSADTSDSAMDYDIGTVTGASYNVHTIHNVDGREKLYIGQQMTTSSGDGSGTVPKRREWAGKFTTTSGQINKIKVTSNGSGNMASGSYITVYGAKESATADSISIDGGEQTPTVSTLNASNGTTNWSADTSKLTKSGNTITFSATGSSNDEEIYYDLTSTSDDKWTLRFKADFTSIGAGNNAQHQQLQFGIFDSTNPSGNASGDAIIFYLSSAGNVSNAVNGVNGGTGSITSTNNTPIASSGSAVTYYIELQRTSSSAIQAKVFSDEYVTQVGSTLSKTGLSGITGLRYLMVRLWGESGAGNGSVGSVTNMKFYNNVSSLRKGLTTTKNNYRLEAHLLGANTRVLVTFNDDSSSLYSYRFSANGASDSEGNVGTTSFNPTVATSPDEKYLTMDISNDQTKPKFVNADLVDDAYNRMELTGKYANSTDLIDKIKITNNDSNGSFTEGSEMILWGSDGDSDTTYPKIEDEVVFSEDDTGNDYIWDSTTNTWTKII